MAYVDGSYNKPFVEMQKFKQIEKNALVKDINEKIIDIKKNLGLDIIIDERRLNSFEKKELREMPAKMYGSKLLANEAEELFNQLTSLEKILTAYPKDRLPKKIIIFSSASKNGIGGTVSGWNLDGSFNAKEVRERIYLNSDAKPEIVHHEFFHYYHFINNFPWKENENPIMQTRDSVEDAAYKNISGEANYGETIFIEEEISENDAKKLIDLISKYTKYKFDDSKKRSLEKLGTIITVYNPRDPDDIRNAYTDTVSLYEKFLPYPDNKIHAHVKCLKNDFLSFSIQEQARQLKSLRYAVIKLIGQKNNLIKEQKSFITEYARTAFGEDLCETYGLMMAGKITRQMLSPKIIEKMEFITGYKFNINTLSFTSQKVEPSYFGKWHPERTFEYWNKYVKTQ